MSKIIFVYIARYIDIYIENIINYKIHMGELLLPQNSSSNVIKMNIIWQNKRDTQGVGNDCNFSKWRDLGEVIEAAVTWAVFEECIER